MYKIGDKVIIRDWHEVAKERGQEKGKIYCEAHCVYDFSMNDYAGERAVIEEVQEYKNTGENWYRLASESGELLPYHWTDSMLARRDVSMAEEKFADRPQIQKGDIIRFISGITGEENVAVARNENNEAFFDCAIGEVLAIYRFDGRDFKCIWESREYQLQRWNEACKLTIKLTKRSIEDWKDVLAALEKMNQYAKEAGDGKQ